MMNRRQFAKLIGRGTLAIPAGALVTASPSHADEMPMVDPEEATAKALQYVVESANENNCAGCLLYTGEAGAEAGPCSIFPGKQVPAAAWCSAFQPKPA